MLIEVKYIAQKRRKMTSKLKKTLCKNFTAFLANFILEDTISIQKLYLFVMSLFISINYTASVQYLCSINKF